jgi:hypothetical protein
MVVALRGLIAVEKFPSRWNSFIEWFKYKEAGFDELQTRAQ